MSTAETAETAGAERTARPLGAAAERTARPLRADAARNRERVIEAAEELFASAGGSVPIDEVARRAGVGVGTLYRHFPTKEALLQAIWTRRMDRLVEAARAHTAAEDPGAAFFAFLGHIVEQASGKRDLATALASAGVDVEAASASSRAALTEAIAQLLERAQRAGAVRPDIGMPELFGLVAGTCMAAEQGGAAGCSLARMLDIVCDGLRAGGGGDGG